jgi:hypothetical protein
LIAVQRVLPITLVGLLAVCRGAPTTYTPPEREITAADPRRLTFNTGSDVSPVWSRAGDSVYYSAPGFDVFPRAAGVLLGVDGDGGAARLLVPSVQSGGNRYLVAPAFSASGDRVAYFDVQEYGGTCPGARGFSCGSDPDVPPPYLNVNVVSRARLYVRATDDQSPLSLDARIDVVFPVSEELGQGRTRTRIGSRQLSFFSEGVAWFRPTWAPDGNRIAFSDGASLRIWTIGQPATAVIPNTTDAVEAAWSPDGNWIAYRRPVESEFRRRTCVHTNLAGLLCTEERIFLSLDRSILTVIRPDGTGKVELGEGSEPAWAPDSRTIYFRRGPQIWRVAREGNSSASPVTGALGAQPAVSPDGSRLAFVRGETEQQKDVWVARLSTP